MKRTRQATSVLFDEIYIVGILLLSWFLFRLSVIVFATLFWNVCVPSALLSLDLNHFGLFWFVVATDVFAIAWLVAYLVRSVRRREGALGRSIFAVMTLLFVIGNIMFLPALYEWRAVEQDADASYTVVQRFAKTFGLTVRSRPYVPRFPEFCAPPVVVEFGRDVFEARDDWRAEFWRDYEARSSDGMERALSLVEHRLRENRGDGEAWAMKALIYGNGVDYGVVSALEASVAKNSTLDKALSLAPHAFVTYAAYALVRGNEDPEGAEARLKQCVAEADVSAHHRRASDPVLRECHNLYGDLLRKTGRPEQARGIYLQGLERWPDNGELHVSYALYLQETGRADEAIQYLREFVADQPRFPRGHWHLAVMLYEEGGDPDEAREHAVKALEMDPKIWNGERLLLELLRVEAGKGY